MNLERIDIDLNREYNEYRNNLQNCENINMLQNPDKLKEELKNIFTTFTVESLLLSNRHDQTELNIYKNFLNIIVNSFEHMLDEYSSANGINREDLSFLYKGGCVLRISYLKIKDLIINRMTVKGFGNIFNNFDDKFKMSDADFTILINPNLVNYDKVLEDINMFTFELLKKIRDRILSSPSNFFYFLNLSNNVKIYHMILLANKIKDALYSINGHRNTILKKIKFMNLEYDVESNNLKETINSVKRTDFVIDKGINYNYLCEIDNTKYAIYTSYNNSLDFTQGYGQNNHASFNLMRSKLMFECILIDRTKHTETSVIVPAELIDISIPKKDDSTNNKFFEKNYNKTDIIKYIGNGSLDGLTFHGPSISYLLKDVSSIIYKLSVFPWIDPKFAKRVIRSITLYAIILISTLNLDIIQLIRDTFIQIVTTLSSNSSYLDTGLKLSQIKKDLSYIFDTRSFNVNKYILSNIKENICLILSSLLAMNIIIHSREDLNFNGEIFSNEILNQKYISNIGVLISNYQFLVDFLDIICGLITLIQNKDPIALDNNRIVNIDMLGGTDYFYKYQTYKKKYLSLKSHNK